MIRVSRHRLQIVLAIIFLLGSIVLLVSVNTVKPRILVIHSLSKDSDWALAVDRGIKQTLQHNRLPVTVTYDYLNLDLVANNANLKVLADGISQKIDRLDPHVLIAVDDETNDLVSRVKSRHRPFKIVYTGLLHPPERYGYTPQSGVWGIREHIPVHGLIDLIETIAPKQSLKIAVIGSADLTGNAELSHVTQSNWGRHTILAHALVSDFDSWKAFVTGPAQAADILLVLSTDKISSGGPSAKMVPEHEIVKWTEANAKPWAVGIRQSFARLGGSIAVSSPPSEFGAMAMELALLYLQATDTWEERASQTTSSFDISIGRRALSQRGITIPQIYIEAARAAGNLHP